ncbi:DUF1295 domain-containing protein [Candidatus Pacearchaeota archaeon]|nr:DUF1295 domain-containing protein [Candidatus Pacearchaeota archaeon]
MISELFSLLVLSIIINLIIFLIAYLLKSDKFTDITYALTFLILILIALFQNNFNFYNLILVILITIWAVRLGSFLFIRINYFKKDRRFDGIREDFTKFMGFFLLQGLTTWIILIPSLLFIFGQTKSINFLFFLGIIIWIKGFLFEAISDYQKFKFIKNKKNKNKFINRGLWKYSRHPNYYGEILCWLGIFILTSPTLYIKSLPILFLGLVSPLFIYLLLRYVSGVKILEKNSDKKFKNNKKYKQYKKETNLLIPWFKKK